MNKNNPNRAVQIFRFEPRKHHLLVPLLLVFAWLVFPGTAAQGRGEGRLVCVDAPQSDESVCAHEFNPQAEQTVVLIHGLHGDPLRDWSGQIPHLSRHYHVLSLQLSSFYRVSEEAKADGVAALTRSLLLLTQRYAKGPVILMAHSMGGVIGLRYAVDYPDTVDRLVLVDVAGVLQRIAFTRSLVTHRKRTEGESELFTRLMEKLAVKVLVGLDGYSAELAAQHQPQGEQADYFPDKPELLAAFQLIDEDFSRSVTTVNLPVLIVWGESDRIAPLRTAYTLAERLPSSQLLIIPQAGHLAMREKPEVFNRAVDNFLTRTPSLHRPEVSYPEREGPLEQVVVCRNEQGRVFTGYYRRIVFNECDGAVIRDARVAEVVANGSRLEIVHSNIGGGSFGLSATGSVVEITASRIEGETALILSRSRIDMAAVELVGRQALALGERGSDLLFSLSTLRSPLRSGPIHGYFNVDSAHPL